MMKSLLLVAALALTSGPSHAAVELAGRIELPDATGRLDHLAIDAAGNRLSIAALGADSIEVVDLNEGKRSVRLRGKKRFDDAAAAVCDKHQCSDQPVAAGVLYPAFGLLLSPMIAALAMSLSSASVVFNALRLRTS